MNWSGVAAAVAAGVIVVGALVGARLIDRFFERRVQLPPEARTRFRVVLRSAEAGVIAFAVLSALLVIPGVRPVASGILASSALVGIIVGFAARPTLGNFFAGLAIAFAQPIRIGDQVEVGGIRGRVEEIGRSFATITTPDGGRLLVPNERLSTDVVRNFTIGIEAQRARVTVAVPVAADVEAVLALIAEAARSVPEAVALREPAVSVAALSEAAATVALDVWARDVGSAERLASELRLRIHRHLREHGVYSE